METSRSCKSCKKKTLIRDELGTLVCESCGIEQQFDNFQSHFSGLDGPQGTFIRIGSSTNQGDFDNKQLKIYHATQKIEEVGTKLGLSSSTIADVKKMMEEITEGELGDGNWFNVFIGACCYVVMRKNRVSFSMAEIAAELGCELHELGRMVIRVINHLNLNNLPDFDIILSFERAIKNCKCFSRNVCKEKLDKMIKEGRLLLNCSVKWFLTTGRQPLPVVVAVLVFVGELNLVKVSIEEVAKELHAGVVTCKKRLVELKETLVKAAQALPWGKNVTVKNIVHNAPLVLRYMEMKSSCKAGEKKKICETGGFDLDEVVNECLKKDDFDIDNYITENYSSQCFEHESGNSASAASANFDNLDTGKISLEHSSNTYRKFSSGNYFVKPVNEGGEDYRNMAKNDVSLWMCNTALTGESDLSKKLFLKEILEKNVGFDNMPPSFVAGEQACKRRREKIIAAKQRIDEIMKPSSSVPSEQSLTLEKGSQDRKKRKRKANVVNVDWEDYIIETLLLHQVKEEEIEQGHYKRMIDLYVFDSEKTCNIFKRKKR
ncbi:Plant-specific tfiib-related protein ptf2 [Thalictrum thalictroides]|uniref:Plant-specific tfiib-related protein ptf2 n=1 Tax=Thalictrum thalictroides TaxID=46969 RepID=A0A7J6WAW1_THATH|nr:Plant-specific tfiib-related protein ptf2 [Thalictrum thalictroides]